MARQSQWLGNHTAGARVAPWLQLGLLGCGRVPSLRLGSALPRLRSDTLPCLQPRPCPLAPPCACLGGSPPPRPPVLGLRPRRCSRVQTLNPLALALTDAPCPAARSPAAPTWLGLSACALLSGLLLRAARRMPAVAVPNFPMARQFRWPRAGVSGTSPALAHRRLALTVAPCFFVTLAAACSRPTGSAPTLRRPLGPPVPSEFRACGAPVPTLRRSPPLRGRAVMTLFFGWRPERYLGGNGPLHERLSYGHGGM